MNYEYCQEAEAVPPWQAEMLLRALSSFGMTGREGGQQVIFTSVLTRQSQNLYRQTSTFNKTQRRETTT